MKRIVTLFAALIFCASFCWGQNMCHQAGAVDMCTNYTDTATYFLSDNIPYAQTHNVWHLLPATPAMIKVESGVAGSWSLDSASHIYELSSEINGSWNMKSGAASDVCVGANVYVVGATQGSSNLYKWNGSGWTLTGNKILSHCADGADDDLWGINSAGNIFHFVSGAFTQVAGAGSDLTVGDAQTVYVIGATQSGKNIYYWTGTAWTQPLPGILTKIRATTGGADIYGLNGSVIKIYHNGAWVTVQGGCSWITNGGSLDVKCVGATVNSASVYQFPDQALNVSMNVAGNTTCQDHVTHAPVACPTSTHTPTAAAHFGSKSVTGGQTVVGAGGSPETHISATATDQAWDPFVCLEDGFDSSLCLGSGPPPGPAPNGAEIQCSILGAIFADGNPNKPKPPTLHWDQARTRLTWAETPSCGTQLNKCLLPGQSDNQKGCTYTASFIHPWQFYCNDGNTDPDYGGPSNPLQTLLMNDIVDCETNSAGNAPPPGLWGFDIGGQCLYSGSNGAPIFCTYNVAGGTPTWSIPIKNPPTPPLTRGLCTFNDQLQ